MGKKKTIDESFFEFHKSCPLIFDLFYTYAKEVMDAGIKHYSMDAVMHRVRWHLSIETKGDDGFKINNNYSSRYSRLLTKFHPEFKQFFRKRKLKTFSILED